MRVYILSQSLAWIVALWGTFRGTVGRGIADVLAFAFLIIVSFVATKIWRAGKWVYGYFQRMNRVLRDVGRNKGSPWPREGIGLWVAQPISKLHIPDYDHNIEPARILVVANAKGGVGKTTVTASLGGRFAEVAEERNRKPILLIDLDFQGSLSSMSFVGEENWLPGNGRDSEATYLLSGDRDANDIANFDKTGMVVKSGQLTVVPKQKVITSYYDLAQAENRLMIEWLLGDRKTDLRIHLGELLHSNAVRSAYSLIIIDCPPRLTTGAIQALAAGTHLLVPTILDNPSAEAVVTFVRQVETFRRAGLCPSIEYVGVVATMVDPRQKLGRERQNLDDRLSRSWDQGGVDGKISLLPEATEIPDNVAFRDAAGRGNPYFAMGDGRAVQSTKSAIQALAAQVARKMNLPQD